MNVELKRLTEVSKADIIDLMNSPLVRKYMPLATGKFDENRCDKFIAAKEKLWDEHGYGPWAFIVNGQFAGWGGLQPEQGEVEIALVLHPNHWGIRKTLFLYKLIIRYAFQTLKLKSVIALFPPSRTRIKGILRLGFKEEGELMVKGEPFICYRLNA